MTDESNVIQMPDGSVIIDDYGISLPGMTHRLHKSGKTAEEIAAELGADVGTVQSIIDEGEPTEPHDWSQYDDEDD